MKAVVYHGVGDIRLESVPDPGVRAPTDAVIRVTASAICGTDLHMVRGTLTDMVPGTILGHEAVGIVEEAGPDVRDLSPGDRVVIPSTIACGACSYCRAGYYAQCDVANPNGPGAGTSFFGGPRSTGPVDGLQAEYARIPYAHTGPVKLPETVSDEDALLLSDVFPTAWFGARLAEVSDGDTVAVLGCGVVGQLAITSALMQGAGRVLAVDAVPSRLDAARWQGAETIDFSAEDPVETARRLTNGVGVDRVIDAVGVDAERPSAGPAAESAADPGQMRTERELLAPEARDEGPYRAGGAPSQALRWATAMAAKAGTVGIIGVYPPAADRFPIGEAMNKNLTVRMGNCNHRRYLPALLDMVRSETLRLAPNITQDEPMGDAIAAYEAFDAREPGWIKVKLDPGASRTDRMAA